MNVFLDSSVLVRLKDPNISLRHLAERAIEILDNEDMQLLLSPQVLMEYWAVSTRPASARGGLGLTAEEAAQDVEAYRSWFIVIPEDDRLFTTWWHVVRDYHVLGRQVWDARIAAMMKLHGIPHLLTFNTQDFQRFDFLRAWSPEEVDKLRQVEL